MKKSTAFILGLFLFCSCKQTELPLQFMQLLNRSQMTFIEPDGYKRIDSLPDDKMNCTLAYLHPNAKFEVRYAILPMDLRLKEYENLSSKRDSGEIIIHPNQLYIKDFKSSMLKITDGALPTYNIFSSTAVKNEFNADWGATATINVGIECGLDYKYCYFISIHKDNLADAYIYFLGDDLKIINAEMIRIIHNLRFRF